MANLALSPEAIGRALFRENVLGVLLREIQLNTDIPFDQRDLAEAIHGMLTPAAQEQMAPLRARRTKPATKRNLALAAPSGPMILSRIHDHTPPPTPPAKPVTKPATRPALKLVPRPPVHASR